MDFVNELFSSSSCNVDGTIGMNPFTSFSDHILDSETLLANTGFDHSSYEVNIQDSAMEFPSMMSQGIAETHALESTMNVQSFHPNYMNQAFPYPAFQPYIDPQYYISAQRTDQVDEEMFRGDDVHDMSEAADQYIAEKQAADEDMWGTIQENLEAAESQTEYQFRRDNPFYSPEKQLGEEELQSLFSAGMERYAVGQVGAAIQLFEASLQHARALDGSFTDTDSWHMLGVCHADNDEDKKAIRCFTAAIDCDPYNARAFLALGTSYVNELDSVKALETLRSWITHSPRFQGLRVESDEYSDGTLMDEVLQLVLQAQQCAPDDRDVLTLLGVLYNVSLDYDSAVGCFQKALEASPEDFSLLNKIGATLANGNRSEEAIAFYERALAMRPSFARAWLNLAISHANLNRHEEAAAAYIRAIGLNPDARHMWGYLRVTLTAMDRLDLVELAGREDLAALAAHFQI